MFQMWPVRLTNVQATAVADKRTYGLHVGLVRHCPTTRHREGIAADRDHPQATRNKARSYVPIDGFHPINQAVMLRQLVEFWQMAPG